MLLDSYLLNYIAQQIKFNIHYSTWFYLIIYGYKYINVKIQLQLLYYHTSTILNAFM